MDWKRDCAVIIPCFNEEADIAEIVSAVREKVPAIIVVDDGSTDATALNARAAGAEIISHPVNEGKGAALLTGWKRARERKFSWALTMDGDGQHAADDIARFFQCAETTGAPLVIGNRMGQASAMPWLRRQVNRWMSRRLTQLARAPLPDSQCGFRLVNLDALFQLNFVSRQFEIESDVLLAFVNAGLKVEFVPIQVIYKSRPSKIHPLRDTWRWLRWWREVATRRRDSATLARKDSRNEKRD